MSEIRKLDITDIKPELDETSTALLNNVEIQTRVSAPGRIRGFLG